jgi:allophanate hydrolase subunit 1
VPRGAVAIADRQTAVYPAVSPGGWNLIGNCPQRMFDPDANPSMPVAVGDRVRFEPISRGRFLELGGELP